MAMSLQISCRVLKKTSKKFKNEYIPRSYNYSELKSTAERNLRTESGCLVAKVRIFDEFNEDNHALPWKHQYVNKVYGM